MDWHTVTQTRSITHTNTILYQHNCAKIYHCCCFFAFSFSFIYFFSSLAVIFFVAFPSPLRVMMMGGNCCCCIWGASSFLSQVIEVINFRDPTRFFLVFLFLLSVDNHPSQTIQLLVACCPSLLTLLYVVNLCSFFDIPCFSDSRSFVIPNFTSTCMNFTPMMFCFILFVLDMRAGWYDSEIVVCMFALNLYMNL